MGLIDDVKQWAADKLIGEGEVEKKKILSTYEKIQAKDDPKEKLEHVGVSEFELIQSSEYYYNSIYYNFSDKNKIIKEWREMAGFPEIADALDNICDEAIDTDENGEVIKLHVNNEKLLKNENKMKNLQGEWEHILDITDFNMNAFNLFRKFYVEAELFGEMVINPSAPKEGIKKIIILSPETMRVDLDEYENIKSFKQRISIQDPKKIVASIMNKEGLIEFSNNMIAYVNSGVTTKNENGEISNIAYIDRAKVAFRQLKWMEDALLIYRIVRAPARKVYTIDVGNLPKKKAEEYMQTIINRLKTRKVYNSLTGEIDLGKNTQAMTEDIFLPKRSDGSGPGVVNMEGQAQMGDITDVIYFVKKLYKALKVPTKRLDEADTTYFFTERDGETPLEEVKFAKYVHRVRQRWVSWLKQIFIMHLKLKGLWEQYDLNENDIDLIFTNSNSWRDAQKMKNWTQRLTLFDAMVQHENKDFSRTWLKKNILKMSDDEIAENDEMIKKDIEKQKEMNQNVGAIGAGAEIGPGGEVMAGGGGGMPQGGGMPTPSPEGGGMPPIGVGSEIPAGAGGGGAPTPPPGGGEEIKGNETAEVKRFKGSMNNIKGNLGGGGAGGNKP